MSELEMPDLHDFMEKKIFQVLKRLECYGFVISDLLTQGLEDTFHHDCENKFVRGALASLKSSGIALCCGSYLTEGTAATQLRNKFNGSTWTLRHRGQVRALNSQRQHGHGYHNGSRIRAAIRIV